MADPKQPNILVIFGDDIGIWNLSCYSSGMMGYQTPNIDRIAREGMRFTDTYGEQSCTAARASFITGQSVFRTGLSKVGLPGAPVGFSDQDPTIAELLKPLGYATAQFGNDDLGDQNKFLPTVHGFDEFFGKFGPRGVIHSWAIDRDDPTERPRWGRVGKQKIEDTGPLTIERMRTCDEEFGAAAKTWIKNQHKAGTPWFCWFNTTRMSHHDTMIDHDKTVGELLALLDDLGVADDTIVLYSTGNGPRMGSSPDGAMTPFNSEKDSNWEGAFRVPALLRWPGVIRAGAVSTDLVSHHDWLPTLLAAAGEPHIKEKLLSGHEAAGKTLKVHVDGFNLLPFLSGKDKKNPRQGFIYFNDDGDVVALRFDSWKIVFMEQRAKGPLRVPKLFNLRTDPFERADTTSNAYYDWYLSKGYMIAAAQSIAGRFLATFKEFPPRQKAASFTLEQAMETMERSIGGYGRLAG